MTAADCPDTRRCPVPDPPGPVDARRLRTTTWPTDRPFFHVHEHRFGCDEFNPGAGGSRFAPLGGPDPIATLYGSADESVALLETVFHDLTADPARAVVESVLRDRGLAHLRPPRSLTLIDLRDPALRALGLAPAELLTSSAEHYPCTREWARWLHGRRAGGRRHGGVGGPDEPDGIVWHSRQAELTGGPAGEAFVLWGDRAPSTRGAYPLVGPGVRNLLEGRGRVLVERVAEELDAVVVPTLGPAGP